MKKDLSTLAHFFASQSFFLLVITPWGGAEQQYNLILTFGEALSK